MGEKKKAESLYWVLLKMNIIPIFLLALIITSFSANSFAKAMNYEVRQGLMDLTATILTLYDELYPGDYSMTEQDGAIYLFKGKHQINGDFSIIDKIKENTGTDITLFYQDIRVITTLYDETGERIVGTRVNAVVKRDVLEGKTAMFYPSVSINEKNYFAYYTPLMNADGACVGMIFAAKPTDSVNSNVRAAVMPIIFLAAAAMLAAGYFTIRFSNKLIRAIGKIEFFLEKVAKGNLNANLAGDVLKRRDELGEMGRYAIRMQKSLRELVEQDILTGLYNRRYADKRLKREYKEKEISGTDFCVAIGDIDYFKNVNDTYGHDWGDVVLARVADIMKIHMQGKGFAARWGGEEFLLVYEDSELDKAVSGLKELMEEIRELQIPCPPDKEIQITMTFGIVRGGGENMDAILKAADQKLYEGKNNGRNQIVQ